MRQFEELANVLLFSDPNHLFSTLFHDFINWKIDERLVFARTICQLINQICTRGGDIFALCTYFRKNILRSTDEVEKLCCNWHFDPSSIRDTISKTAINQKPKSWKGRKKKIKCWHCCSLSLRILWFLLSPILKSFEKYYWLWVKYMEHLNWNLWPGQKSRRCVKKLLCCQMILQIFHKVVSIPKP